jgi:hypothetical protein
MEINDPIWIFPVSIEFHICPGKKTTGYKLLYRDARRRKFLVAQFGKVMAYLSLLRFFQRETMGSSSLA